MRAASDLSRRLLLRRDHVRLRSDDMRDRESAPTASLGPRPTHDSLERAEIDLDLDAYSEAEDGRMAMIGHLLVGKYMIEELIGSGGVGVVYGGRHCELERPVAIKVLAPLWASHGDAITRFEREARCLSALGHPNVVDVYDFGRLEDGRPYLVMERLTGESLGRRLRRVKRLTIDEAAAILAQIASALDRVHELGVVHRDIKPDNVFLTTDFHGQETAKLLDFGLATAPTDRRLTQDGCVCGTPDYLAPEVANHAELDRSADIYALGVTLFEMLAGRVPFDGPSPWSILARKHAEPAPTLSAATRTVFPEEVERVVAKALERDPAKRHATAGELEAEFRRAVNAFREEQTPLIHAPETPPPQATPTTGPVALESNETTPAIPKRRTGVWMLAAILAFAAAVGTIWISLADPRADARPNAIPRPMLEARERAPQVERAEMEPAVELDLRPGAIPILGSSAEAEAPELPVGIEAPEEPLWSQPPPEPPVSMVARPRVPQVQWSEPPPHVLTPVETVAIEEPPRPLPEPVEPAPPRSTPQTSAAEEAETRTALTREAYRRLARGELALAVERFEAAGPRNPGAVRGLGLAYERLGRREDAVRAYRRYLELLPNAADRAAVEHRLDALR
jgi:serine/threonine-protein kinase